MCVCRVVLTATIAEQKTTAVCTILYVDMMTLICL